MWKTILDLLFPIYCLGCGQEGAFICSTCFKKIKINKKLYFDKTDILKKTLVAGHYQDELLKQAIYKYKYDFVKSLANPLGELMVKKLKSRLCLSKGTASDFILIPIPLHPRRLRWRGFNQAELLAQAIGQKLNIPIINNLLIRTRRALPQAKIQNASQRKQNIHNVFELTCKRPRVLRNQDRALRATSLRSKVVHERRGLRLIRKRVAYEHKIIILIDDISTTGATLREAARTLNNLKPKQIWGLVLTKG